MKKSFLLKFLFCKIDVKINKHFLLFCFSSDSSSSKIQNGRGCASRSLQETVRVHGSYSTICLLQTDWKTVHHNSKHQLVSCRAQSYLNSSCGKLINSIFILIINGAYSSERKVWFTAEFDIISPEISSQYTTDTVYN